MISQLSNDDLLKLRKIQKELLNEFVSICKELKLDYWLDYGTLLGAHRHKSFIPWDDDIDIGMPIGDLEIFKHHAPKLLNKRFELDLKTGRKIHSTYVKLRHKNSRFYDQLSSSTNEVGGIYIDIFPYTKSPPRNFIFSFLIWVLLTSHFLKYERQGDYNTKEFIKFKILSIFEPIAKPLYLMFSNNHWIALPPIDNGTCKIFKYDEVYPLSQIEFDGVWYNAPASISTYLKIHYGADYMTLPPVEKRTFHAHKIEIYD